MDRRNALMGLAAMAGMGGLNPKPLNAPPAGPLSLGIQPGAPTGVFTRLIVSASGAFTGIFVYSPSPGAGNLIFSVAASPGTDPFGNAYKNGATSYETGTAAYSQLLSGSLFLGDTAGDTYGLRSIPSGGLGYLQIRLFNNNYAFFGAVAGAPSNTLELIANQPNSIAPEVWHTMTISAVGFAAGTQAPQFQLMALGTTGQIHLRGAINLTANQVSGAIFFTLPTGYHPSTNQEWVTASSLSGASLAGTVSVDTSGNLALGSAGSTGNLVRLDGIVIQL